MWCQVAETGRLSISAWLSSSYRLPSAASHRLFRRIRLSAGQYLEVIVKQQGIDVIVLLSGPDGKQGSQGDQNWEFDTESRLQGQEVAPLVAEVTGEYRLMVRPRQKDARAGGYEIRIEELRAATEIDRE